MWPAQGLAGQRRLDTNADGCGFHYQLQCTGAVERTAHDIDICDAEPVQLAAPGPLSAGSLSRSRLAAARHP
jgi:hypothetical protein